MAVSFPAELTLHFVLCGYKFCFSALCSGACFSYTLRVSLSISLLVAPCEGNFNETGFLGGFMMDLNQVPCRNSSETPPAALWYTLESKTEKAVRGDLLLAIWWGSDQEFHSQQKAKLKSKWRRHLTRAGSCRVLHKRLIQDRWLLGEKGEDDFTVLHKGVRNGHAMLVNASS